MFHTKKQMKVKKKCQNVLFLSKLNTANVRCAVFIQRCSGVTVWTGMHIGACLYSTELLKIYIATVRAIDIQL